LNPVPNFYNYAIDCSAQGLFWNAGVSQELVQFTGKRQEYLNLAILFNAALV